MGVKHQLYRVDAVLVGDLFATDDAACHEGHYELRGGNYGRNRPLSIVRDHITHAPLRFLSAEPSWFVPYQDMVLRRVCNAQRVHENPPDFYLLFRSGRRHYHGPHANAVKIGKSAVVCGGDGEEGEKGSVDDKNEGITVSHEIQT
jgi:hypothetical protein